MGLSLSSSEQIHPEKSIVLTVAWSLTYNNGSRFHQRIFFCVVLICSQKLLSFTVATILLNVVSEKIGVPSSYAAKFEKIIFFFKKKVQENLRMVKIDFFKNLM